MIAATKSPKAHALYRQILTEWNAQPLRLCSETDLTDAELWWSDLTPLESWVFGIDPALHNALLLAYIRYTDMIGMMAQDFHEVAGEDRAAFPECFMGDCVFSFEAAVSFMMAACEMPQVQSMMWVSRVLVQNVRSGLYGNETAAPACAPGKVDPSGLFYDPSSWCLENARGYAEGRSSL